MRVRNWIFVTGAPRGGTTFAGVVLSKPYSVDYIHEPFNPDCGIPGVSRRYLYVDTGTANEPHVRRIVERIQRYDFSLTTAFYPRDSRLKRLGKAIVGSRGPFYLRLAKLNPLHRAAVIKDPIGCLLGSYLTREFGFRTLALIRHPLAFVASTLRLGWNIDAQLADIRAQPELIERYLPYENLTTHGRTPVESAAVLWRALNKVILAQAEQTPAILVRTHEALSLNPVTEFRTLYDELRLAWSPRIERYVRRMTGEHNRTEARAGRVQDFARDSAKLLDLRIEQLGVDDRRQVYEIVQDVAHAYYPETTFRL
jgi:hypothetical protein